MYGIEESNSAFTVSRDRYPLLLYQCLNTRDAGEDLEDVVLEQSKFVACVKTHR